MGILAVNAGSSTLKFSVHPLVGNRVGHCVLSGSAQGLEPGGSPVLHWRRGADSQCRTLEGENKDPFDLALRALGNLLAHEAGLPTLQAVAHRVVHGGQDFSASVVVDEQVLERLSALNSLAPLHQPQNIKGIRAFQKAFHKVPHIACFDTAFHAQLSALNHSFALPQALIHQGVRRYGFHGLSYQYVMGVLQQQSDMAQGRVLMAHLGNGASLCAALNGNSVATTMGFSALDGLMMGTRCGALDAGVLLYLLEQGWTHDELESLLYRQSGLLGVSGISADMRRLRSDGSAAAQHAIDLFTHRVVRESGALVACLEGLDVLAFSGGIGEHDVTLRADVCKRLHWLGVVLNEHRNAQATGATVHAIHHPSSRVEVWVIPTDEGLVAAREAARLIGATPD